MAKITLTGQEMITAPIRIANAVKMESRIAWPSTSLRSVADAVETRLAVNAWVEIPRVAMITSSPRSAPSAPKSAGSRIRAETMLSK